MDTIIRPVWRAFPRDAVSDAVAHCQQGGLAVLRKGPRWTLVVPTDADGDVPELCAWALMDLDVRSPKRYTAGAASGLTYTVLTEGQKYLVRRWLKRDKGIEAGRTEVALDCVACGACCRKNKVILEDEDFDRWRDVGREELGERPYVRRQRGRRLLVLLDNGDCQHLRGNLCGIYDLRPDNCRAFPAGSEPCLSTRLEDGVATPG